VILFLILVLAVKGYIAQQVAPTAILRFRWRPGDWHWVVAQVCVNGQLLVGIVLAIAGVESKVPTWAAVVGVLSCLGGHALHVAAMAVNQDFRPEIIRPETICRHSLYRAMHHPGYFGLCYAALGQTLLLGHKELVLFFFPYVALLAYRIFLEERLLWSTQGN
jgi:protein-S-isoprenylcysteine O-methyltransferase Ste14